MAIRSKFRIEGLKELEEALAELPKATGKTVLRRALTKAATPVVSIAESLAPKRRGTLRLSVGSGPKLSRRQRRLHRPQSTVEIFAGAGALAQAITQEFGTAHHPPQSFMRPAWDAGKMPALEAVKGELASEIAKTIERRARRAARAAAALKK